MKESHYIIDKDQNNESIDIKEIILNYIKFWPWFLGSIFIALFFGYLYTRYAPVIYSTVAKIKIIDDAKEFNVASNPLELLNNGSDINMDNEIEILKSYKLLSQVVDELDLDVSYQEVGTIKTRQAWNAPFFITKLFDNDSLKKSKSFEVEVRNNNLIIINEGSEDVMISKNKKISIDSVPLLVNFKENINFKEFDGMSFRVTLSPKKEATLELSEKLQIAPVNKKSEILKLTLDGESIEKSEVILNTVIQKFNDDGVQDRQLVSKRTLDFIDERLIYLSTELDSIEVGKKDFKTLNNLSYIEADAGATLQKRAASQNEAETLQTQVALTKLIKNNLEEEDSFNTLPSNLGLENSSVNNLTDQYNDMIFQREKLLISVGENHPTLKVLNDQIKNVKKSIVRSVANYQSQLRLSLGQVNQERSIAGSVFSSLPEKEKMLRSIERQQSIKENLFLLLLQKREEAAINFAVTAPSVKVVDYGLTSNTPLFPKKMNVYLIALFLGVLLPLATLFVLHYLDTKIHSRLDVEKLNPEIPVAAEIPFLDKEKVFQENSERSVLTESFRILSASTNYLLPVKKDEGQVILVTSAVKGEGKSLTAFNLSLAYASIKKKVLLVGADLRNPQLHTFFDTNKNVTGLVDYLYDSETPLDKCINNGYNNNQYHHICFSGSIPPNAPELLSGESFEKFLNEVKKSYDFIIIDSAPVLLVADTLLISKYADLTLFLARAGFTDKKLLSMSKELNRTNKINNMAYVVNEVGNGKTSDYNYGYGYGYNSEE
ncbi:polysaccharide biosynthesis tyrosine autokinase [Cellulophaga sp. HaHaR_3_176]|uniref:GumC family protein n=1 Tax=Cellulophaga sp. HaHaR_3_176 TaxID=1942464 RepID=UPI001C1FBC44|nr:tyrosine-protein kinase [Cellulophaga sp. HaHaR_3_176]QWX84361.1 polysaccharide biosynthesis tyrosine autokinase [Cellulophaga sp. HaHaR_3_176]